MKRTLLVGVLMLAALLPACRRQQEVSVTRHVTYTGRPDSSDVVGLPAAFRYPGARVLSQTCNETNHVTGGHYLMQTGDSLATVSGFYDRAMSEAWVDHGASRSDQLVTFDATSEDGTRGIFCTLTRKDEGTLILIVNWERR